MYIYQISNFMTDAVWIFLKSIESKLKIYYIVFHTYFAKNRIDEKKKTLQKHVKKLLPQYLYSNTKCLYINYNVLCWTLFIHRILNARRTILSFFHHPLTHSPTQ